MRKTTMLLAALVLLSGVAYSGTYDVVSRFSEIKIDGDVNEGVWKNVPSINGNFRFPWEKAEAPNTVFKAFHNGRFLFFSFVCEDPAVLVKEQFGDERATVDVEDRVELFFAPSPIHKPVDYKMPTYYAVEIDALGRVHDYSMQFYRSNMDSSWRMPGLKTAGKLIDNGYSVEGSIPLDELIKLGVLEDTSDDYMLVGVFRAEFSGDMDNPDKLIQRWISWVDPFTDDPDFHVDEAFGYFRLLK